MFSQTRGAITAFLLGACATFAQPVAAGTPPPKFYLHEVFMPTGNTDCTPYSISDNNVVALSCEQPDRTRVLYRYYLNEGRAEYITMPAIESSNYFFNVSMNNLGDLAGNLAYYGNGQAYSFFVPSGSVEAQRLIVNGDNLPGMGGITDERLIYGGYYNNDTRVYNAYAMHIIDGPIYNYALASGSASRVWLNSSSTIVIAGSGQAVYGKVGDAVLHEFPAGVNPISEDYLDDHDVLHGPLGNYAGRPRWATVDGTGTGNYKIVPRKLDRFRFKDSSQEIFKVGSAKGYRSYSPTLYSEDTAYDLKRLIVGGIPNRMTVTAALSINRSNKIVLEGNWRKRYTSLPKNTFFLACPTPGCQ